ncbi:MAG: NADH-quinone oxidoreductase subunit NuoF [Elusimicrobia bacterium]|nr:NADH-quinone oxidoreductase subunit NuoF [Elusimicrobiota bacterium]
MTKVLTEHWDQPRLHELETYRRLGGYEALKKVLGMDRAQLIDEAKKSNLRGLGGAGFATSLKWSTVTPEEKNPGPRYVVVNCDESEPGCFKDRVLATRNPHQLIEGLLIAACAIDAKQNFIFIRGEYQIQYEILEKALAEARGAGIIKPPVSIDLMRGAGAYMSGLDTALLETMEGKKAWPRQPPPFPTASGLMGRPTVVNNVETLCMVPSIVLRGGEWFAKLGTAKSGGTALFSVSGHVEKPGVYEFAMGTPLREILAAAGGVKGGRKLKAVIPGGVSTPVLTADELDTPMDWDGPRAQGSFLGAGGVIVLDETTDMVMVAHNIERFLAHESCGQCTPCRQGSYWYVRILERALDGGGVAADLDTLRRTGEDMTGKVICALGDTVGLVTRAMMKKFSNDFKAKFHGEPPHG